MSYRLNAGGGVVRLSDKCCIPEAPGNREWEEFLRWQAEGNVALPVEQRPAPTETELVAECELRLADPDRMQKLNFEVNFDQENRIRVLEGKQPITRAQYRNALANVYKTL